MQKTTELLEMTDRIKAAFQRGQKCSNCHKKNHSVRSCTGDKCESSFLCGDLSNSLCTDYLSKHSDEKLAIQVKKRDISTMEAAAKIISQELTACKTVLLCVNNSIATSIEETLLYEFPDEYSENGVKDWLKIQQDVALVKKSFKGNAVPSHITVKRIIEEKYEDKILNLKSRGDR